MRHPAPPLVVDSQRPCGAVHAPRCCQPVASRLLSADCWKMFLVPRNDASKVKAVKARFTVKLLPPRDPEEVCSFNEHWLFCKVFTDPLVWTNNGSFALHSPQIGFILTLGQPEGRIHFAGEHTSAWTGWMQGALESARRVVREING